MKRMRDLESFGVTLRLGYKDILERDARTGTRYKEYLKGAWGVTSPDARLDRSEYIGGCRVPININQVVQTSSTNETSPQGNTGAYSMTTNSQHMCTYSATEHGFVIGLACVRVQHSYQYGLRRMWTRSTRFSYYDPMLANLGEQAVLNQEIFAQGNENLKQRDANHKQRKNDPQLHGSQLHGRHNARSDTNECARRSKNGSNNQQQLQ